MTCVSEVPRGGGGVDDEESIELAIQLQLQDAELYTSSSKGKGREGDESDETLAFRLQTQELENFPLFRADNQMARSMASAVYADGPLVAQIQSQEETAAGDRDVASQLTQGVNPTGDAGSEEGQVIDDELLEKLRIFYISGCDDVADQNDGKAVSRNGVEAESSASAAGRASDSSTMNRRCEACRDEVKFFDIARTPCGHEFCRECLGELFEASMTDETLFPPRCCRQRIIMANVRMFLKPELVRSFEEKRVEFETPNRTYCHSPRCSMFIHPCNIEDDVATCPECHLTTCTTCKGPAHEGDCPNDTLLQQVLDTARENGWQRCYNCWRVVELNYGCNHMTFVTHTLQEDLRIYVLITCQLYLRSSILLHLRTTLEELRMSMVG